MFIQKKKNSPPELNAPPAGLRQRRVATAATDGAAASPTWTPPAAAPPAAVSPAAAYQAAYQYAQMYHAAAWQAQAAMWQMPAPTAW